MPLYAILAALTVALCWGGNYSATKFALMEFPPFMMLLLRFLGVAIVLAPFALRQPWPRWRDMLFLATTLIVIQFGLVFSALDMGLSITSVIIATQMGVPFACVMAAIFFKDYLGPWRSFGLAVAFMGVMVVAGTPNASDHWFAFLLAVMGSLSWSAANLYLKVMKTPPLTSLLFWPAMLSVPMLTVITLLLEHDQIPRLMAGGWRGWGGVAYALFFSSLVGYGLWNWLMTRFPLSHVMPYSLLMPIAGVSAGVMLFDEQVTPQVLFGGGLTIVGVAIITLRRPKLADAGH